ncbi:unnamed protein product [Choristocarpus tenellus]
MLWQIACLFCIVLGVGSFAPSMLVFTTSRSGVKNLRTQNLHLLQAGNTNWETTCDRREAATRIWRTAVIATVSSTFGSKNARGAEVPDDVEGEITYPEFNRLLFKGEIVRCKFYGSNYDTAVVELKNGSKAKIGAGYPRESPGSDESPVRVIAQLRNAGIPYSTPFDLMGYSKPLSYKSAETLQADKRQQDEDETMERLMSDGSK